MPSNSEYDAGAVTAGEHTAALELATAASIPQPQDRSQAALAPTAVPAGRTDAGRMLRLIALIAVAVGLAALTAAACALSYSSVHHLATEAGVSARLASIYPLILDALLVIAGCSVLALRGAGLVSRIYGWLCLLVLLGGLAAGGAIHAAAIKIPHRPAVVVAAVVPWALVLIGFGLLLALLRYAKIRRNGASYATAPQDLPEQAAVGGETDPANLADLVVVESTVAPPRPSLIPGLGSRRPGPSALSHDHDTTPQPTVPAGQAQASAQPRPHRPAVPQADLQLRARLPGPAAEQALADQPPSADQAPSTGQAPAAQTSAGQTPAGQPPAAGRNAPFMPPVGPLHAADEEERGEPTNPRPGEGGPAAQAARESGAEATQGAADLSPAPTVDTGEPGEPTELRRPHSSPTPPED